MAFTKAIASLIPGFQSMAVMGRSVGLVPRRIGKDKINSKKMIGGFTDIIAGTSLIGPTANIIGGL